MKKTVKEWIATNVPKLPEMNQSLKDAFLNEYIHEYKRQLSIDLRQAAWQAAGEGAAEMVKEYTDQFGAPELIDVIFEDEEEGGEVGWE